MPSHNLLPLAVILALAIAVLVGCTDSAATQSPPGRVITSTLSYSPHPVEVGQNLLISGTVSNLGPSNPSATWQATRDGSVTVASGTLAGLPDGSPVPLSFTDNVPLPGDHHYAVTVDSPASGSSSMLLDVPVAYVLVPSIHATVLSATAITLTVTMTNSGAGTVAFVVPFTVTDTQGLASGSLQTFDFVSSPLPPGVSRSQTVIIGVPLSGNNTYTFTIDPMHTLGTNLAGAPADTSLPIGLG